MINPRKDKGLAYFLFCKIVQMKKIWNCCSSLIITRFSGKNAEIIEKLIGTSEIA